MAFQDPSEEPFHNKEKITYFTIVNSNQEKEWCVAPVHNFVGPMLNKWTLFTHAENIIKREKKKAEAFAIKRNRTISTTGAL